MYYGVKYKNARVKTHDGRSFASKLEASLYDELMFREIAGDISNIRCQVHVELTEAKVKMIPDFLYFCHKRQMDIYAEAKGFETPEYRIKIRLWKFYGPGIIEIYRGTHKNIKLVETIQPKR